MDPWRWRGGAGRAVPGVGRRNGSGGSDPRWHVDGKRFVRMRGRASGDLASILQADLDSSVGRDAPFSSHATVASSTSHEPATPRQAMARVFHSTPATETVCPPGWWRFVVGFPPPCLPRSHPHRDLDISSLDLDLSSHGSMGSASSYPRNVRRLVLPIPSTNGHVPNPHRNHFPRTRSKWERSRWGEEKVSIGSDLGGTRRACPRRALLRNDGA